MKLFTTKRLCRAGIISALYVALTYAFLPFAFGPFQIRPAEALCILPLFYVEAVPALWIGCMLSNLGSPYFVYDVLIGSLATLLAAFGSYLVGVFIKKDGVRFTVGGIFPVLFNALIIPCIIVFLCGGGEGYSSIAVAYFTYAGSIALTEAVWVYALGAPIYSTVKSLRKKSIRFLTD
ncbi:MAG: QueT transporter family protein [Clostridia bacterium]|nr:QueT transporter family protein [Clostridia bacterium]